MQSLGEAPALPNNKSYHLATPSGLKRYSDQCRWCLNPRPQLQNNTTTKQHQTEGKGLGPPSKAPEPIRAERRSSERRPAGAPPPAAAAGREGEEEQEEGTAQQVVSPSSSSSRRRRRSSSEQQQRRSSSSRSAADDASSSSSSCHSPDHKQRGDPEETPHPPVTVVLTQMRLRASLSTTELC